MVGVGFGVVLKYQITGGTTGQTPGLWPAKTSVSLDAKRDTLILFAHPRCPCTRATFEELNRILAQCQGRVAAQVWFFKPSGLSGWSDSSLRWDAAGIPGVTVKDDIDGQQAGLFGAETSGFVLLYNPEGKLLFKGGITGSRGHAGDNAGESSIVSLLSGKPALFVQTPVYGCSLTGECKAPAESKSK
jgi:hypothetical protein